MAVQENRSLSCPTGWCCIQFQRWSGSGNKWGADSEGQEEGGQGLHATVQCCPWSREETIEGLFQHVKKTESDLKREWKYGRMAAMQKIPRKGKLVLNIVDWHLTSLPVFLQESSCIPGIGKQKTPFTRLSCR